MGLASLFAMTVFAAEVILSPLPDDGIVSTLPQRAPAVSFGQLTASGGSQVLGAAVDEPAALQQPEKPADPGLPHRKNLYTIAVLGDSMVDTLGPDVPHLKASLRQRYPGVGFTLLNYGVGGKNIENGIFRLTSDYDYLDRHIPSLVSQKPDIVVVESFAYNPFIEAEGEVNRHWLALAKVVDILRQHLPNVDIVIAATIAPNSQIFGDGALHWNSTQKREKTDRINALLINAIRFAQSQRLPLADVMTPSRLADGNGNPDYINPGDRIHYSDAGRELFGKVVAKAIISHKLLE